MSDTTGRYLSPGVYVEEVPSGSRPIEGVGTSVAAFVGLAPAGPVITLLRVVALAGLVAVVLAAARRRRSGRH
jgi:phage tail sheath protein FI